MNPRKVLLLSMAFTAMGTWAQSALGNLAVESQFIDDGNFEDWDFDGGQ